MDVSVPFVGFFGFVIFDNVSIAHEEGRFEVAAAFRSPSGRLFQVCDRFLEGFDIDIFWLRPVTGPWAFLLNFLRSGTVRIEQEPRTRQDCEGGQENDGRWCLAGGR